MLGLVKRPPGGSRVPTGPAITSGFGALGEPAVKDQPGQAGEVVAVEVAERYPSDRGGVDVGLLDRDQCARAAVEQ